MQLNIFDELRQIWKDIPKDHKLRDLTFDIKLHKKLLEIFQVGSYYYFVVNVRRSTFEVVSQEIETVLGYPLCDIDLPFYLSKIHPSDIPIFLNFEAAVERFFKRLSGNKLFKYKIQYDYRIMKADGKYIRMLHQYVIVNHDADDVKTFAIATDISHLKDEVRPMLSFVGLEGEPSFYNVDVQNLFKPEKHIFTRREQQILHALGNGLSSSEISEVLNISKLTVDSHRKNMLRKANARSTTEIVKLAFENGWI